MDRTKTDAVVLGIQKDDQKISLGLRQLDVNPWDMATHNYPPGARVRALHGPRHEHARQHAVVLLLRRGRE